MIESTKIEVRVKTEMDVYAIDINEVDAAPTDEVDTGFPLSELRKLVAETSGVEGNSLVGIGYGKLYVFPGVKYKEWDAEAELSNHISSYGG